MFCKILASSIVMAFVLVLSMPGVASFLTFLWINRKKIAAQLEKELENGTNL